MTSFQYFSSLRTEIIEIISGVKNASTNSFFWDTSTPNFITKLSLEHMYSRYLAKAYKFGFLIVTRHGECPNKSHQGYPVSNKYSLDIIYEDEDYIWTGYQLYQGNRKCICPCARENNATSHHVIDDVIYSKNADCELCEKIYGVMNEIECAIEACGDKVPRSAIRERLLLALLKINDLLLPQSLDEYILKQLKMHSEL